MGSRTTKKLLQNRFAFFCTVMGKRIATDYNDVGAWRLDHVACYGGYNIEEIHNDNGGVSHPFGSQRHKADKLIDMMDFACRAIAITENKDTGFYWPVRNYEPVFVEHPIDAMSKESDAL